MKDKLKEICMAHGIEYTGITPPGPYKELEEILKKRMNSETLSGMDDSEFHKKLDARNFMENAKSVIVCLFPYYTKESEDSNIAMYAQPIDYHKTITKMLEGVCRELSRYIQDFKYKIYTDNGPLVDRYLAWRAGLGFYGLNNQIINEKYGSYVLIGYTINNYEFEPDEPIDMSCANCYKCINSCPGKALGEDFDFCVGKCVSYITQKKGELSSWEENLLRTHDKVFGCDVCLRVCPHNKDVPVTPMDAFKENLFKNISIDDIKDLSNRGFRRAYKDRAFSWRGKGVIERNLKLK